MACVFDVARKPPSPPCPSPKLNNAEELSSKGHPLPVGSLTSPLARDEEVGGVACGHKAPPQRKQEKSFPTDATLLTSPLRTMKKLVELQVATKPWGSSISASSTPALLAC